MAAAEASREDISTNPALPTMANTSPGLPEE
jgi:hypothetical protein